MIKKNILIKSHIDKIRETMSIRKQTLDINYYFKIKLKFKVNNITNRMYYYKTMYFVQLY